MEDSVKALMDKKDALIKELQDRALASAEPDRSPYTCNKCQRPVHFNFVMAPIRASGRCPMCYGEPEQLTESKTK
jgi:rubrerythrin